MILAAALLAAAPVPAASPDMAEAGDRVSGALAGALGHIELLGHCADIDRRGEDAYQALYQRYVDLALQARGLYGIDEPYSMPTSAPRCDRAQLLQHRQAAGRELDMVAGALGAQLARMQGFWIGPLHMCGDDIQNVTVATDESGMPGVTISFAPAQTRAIRDLTAARVGKPLALVLDGQVVVSAIVYEPITGGQISLSPGEAVTAARLRTAARQPC